MPGFSLRGYQQLVRLFEKQVEWIGLSRNAGSILAAIYLSKYMHGQKLNAEEIAEATSYSRSNVGLIISQLEALGLIIGEMDFTQTGRGRRRILYSVEDDSSLASIGLKKTIDKIQESIRDIDSLLGLYNSDEPSIKKMLSDFQVEAKKTLAIMEGLTAKKRV